ncbi:hypothetical protein B0F90DRAFT_1669994 [Multifurca ochricompacta]|uniref:Uncharacterized protein n=1 Tax=Multifurca ochricompacta TaxID=376703 RepID=A0AAD4QL57_9AGAM|nr:hypothetical protein B0F90DRAFT_1669994 [Multifurca ochricompacta]
MAGKYRQTIKPAKGLRARLAEASATTIVNDVVNPLEEAGAAQFSHVGTADSSGSKPKKRVRSDEGEYEGEGGQLQKKARLSVFGNTEADEESSKKRDVDEVENVQEDKEATFFPATEAVDTARARMAHHQLPPGGVEQHPVWNSQMRISLYAYRVNSAKLHRAVLARHLLPFADMEGLPQVGRKTGDRVAELDYDGDTAGEWVLILEVLDDIEHILKTYKFREDFARNNVLWDDIFLLLRLADKFCCLRFREAAISMLTSMYPTQLENYARRQRVNRIVCAPEPTCAATIAITQIAYPYDVPEIIPVALLDLICAPHAAVDREYPIHRGSPNRVVLSARMATMLLFLRGEFDCKRRRWKHAGRATARTLPVQKGGPIGVPCHKWLKSVMQNWNERSAERPVYGCARAFDGLDAETLRVLGGQICGSCKAELERRIGVNQRRLWGSMPKIFDVPEWLEMEKRRSEGHQKVFQWFIDAEKERWIRFNSAKNSSNRAVDVTSL